MLLGEGAEADRRCEVSTAAIAFLSFILGVLVGGVVGCNLLNRTFVKFLEERDRKRGAK